MKALPEERRRAPVPDQTDPNNAPMPLEEWVETWGATYLAMKEVERNLNLGAPPAPDPAMAEVQERFAAYDRSIAALTGELAAARMLRTLDRKHGVSDAEEILDDKFFAWADRQPPEVRQLADSDDPEAVALAVGIYREDAGLPPAEARAPRGPQPPRDSALHAGSLRAGGPVAPTPQSANGELTESEADELWKTTKVEG
ncbi:MAG: hypothetical protein KJ579_08525 [Verrucomicrobia bacterium]|nr:hypothetical protein [Verrucomicrobiota bacterium]